jgi:hypothetical protein
MIVPEIMDIEERTKELENKIVFYFKTKQQELISFLPYRSNVFNLCMLSIQHHTKKNNSIIHLLVNTYVNLSISKEV